MGIISTIQRYAMVGMGVVLVIAATAAYYFYSQTRILEGDLAIAKGNIAQLEQAHATQAETIETIRRINEMNQEGISSLAEKVNEAEAERDRIASEYDSYRDRMMILAARKPGLIQNKMNAATKVLWVKFGQGPLQRKREGENDAQTQPGS